MLPPPPPEPIVSPVPKYGAVSNTERVVAASQNVKATVERTRELFDQYQRAASAGFWDHVLNAIRRQISGRTLESISNWLVSWGTYGLAAASLVGPGLLAVYALKFSMTWLLFVAAAVFGLTALLPYVGGRMIRTLDALIRGTPSRMASYTFLDGVALMALMASITLVISLLLVFLLEKSSMGFGPVEYAILLWFVPLPYAGLLCLHPEHLNVTTASDVSLGEEAVGALSAILKIFIRLAPYLYGAGALLGTGGLVFQIFRALSAKGNPSGFIDHSFAATLVFLACVFTAGLSPLFVYLVSIFGYMLLDVVRCVLIVPGKIDRLTTAMTQGETQPKAGEHHAA